jgi:hypothetical protein
MPKKSFIYVFITVLFCISLSFLYFYYVNDKIEKDKSIDIINITAPTAFMMYKPTGNLEIDIESFKQIISKNTLPVPARVVEKIGITNNNDHIYIIKYWIGDFNRGNVNEYKAIALSKTAINIGVEQQFLVYDNILLSKRVPYRYSYEKNMKGINISNNWDSVALCIDSSKNEIIDYLSKLYVLKSKQEELENKKQEEIEKRRIECSRTLEQIRIIQEEKQRMLYRKQQEENQKRIEIEQTNKQLELQKEQENKKLEQTKKALVGEIERLKNCIGEYNEGNVTKDFCIKNKSIFNDFEKSNNQISKLPIEYLTNIEEYKNYNILYDKLIKIMEVSQDKLEKWVHYQEYYLKNKESESELNERRRKLIEMQQEAQRKSEEKRRKYKEQLERERRESIPMGFDSKHTIK